MPTIKRILDVALLTAITTIGFSPKETEAAANQTTTLAPNTPGVAPSSAPLVGSTFTDGQYNYTAALADPSLTDPSFLQQPYSGQGSAVLDITQTFPNGTVVAKAQFPYETQVQSDVVTVSDTCGSGKNTYSCSHQENGATLGAVKEVLKCMTSQEVSDALVKIAPLLLTNALPRVMTNYLSPYVRNIQTSTTLNNIPSDPAAQTAVTSALSQLSYRCINKGSNEAATQALYALFALLILLVVPATVYATYRSCTGKQDFCSAFADGMMAPFALIAACCGRGSSSTNTNTGNMHRFNATRATEPYGSSSHPDNHHAAVVAP